MQNQAVEPKVGFSAIIFWDFVDAGDKDEMMEALRDMYGEEPEQFGGMSFGGGGWQSYVAGNNRNAIEHMEEFNSIRTRVESSDGEVLDVATFAVLSNEQIRMVLEKQDRSGLEELCSIISDHLGPLPSFVDHQDSNRSGIYYSEWSDGDLLEGVENGTKDEVVEHLQRWNETLFPFGFQLGGNLSLYEGKFLIAPSVVMSPFDGLAVVRRNQHPNSGPFDKLILSPAWYQGIAGLKRYFRLNQWADERWDELNDLDSEADEVRELLSSLSSSPVDINNVLEVSEKVQDLQIDSTEFRTKFEPEHQAFQNSFSKRTDEATDMFGNEVDISLPRPNEPEEIERSDGKTNSIIEYYEDASENTLEQMNNRHTQVTKKIESIVASVESRTRLAATDENLELQDQIGRLTFILTILTVILVVLTSVLVIIEIL